MYRASAVSLLLVWAATVLGQTANQSYQPAIPAASNYGGYGGGYPGYNYGGTTAAGSAMQGMASAISAMGDYNLATSAAAVNMTQAQRNDIQNRQQWTNTYFEMRAANRAARAAEQGPAASQEQLVRISAARVPKPLGASDVDPVSGRIVWPELLQAGLFDQERAMLDQIASKRANYGSLGLSDASQATSAIESMSGMLQGHVRSAPPQQYAASKRFLKSLMFDMTKSPLN
jgi:hypothetical protein